MTYVAEPYAQYVEDLLTGFTGGHVRETFRMLEEEQPFRLTANTGILPNTLNVFGQAEAADGKYTFHRFILNTDYELANNREIVWRAKEDNTPAADATWPATGSTFYVNYESKRFAGAAPLLTDRSPGSVTRLLAESVAREYAVLSGQLEKVYQAGFLDTATGRDLDNLVALVGLTRYGRNVAEGAVTFSRTTPAPADITIAAATRLTTGDAPAITFETTTDATLQRGQLSVDVPVKALVSDSSGVVPAGSIVAINRPVLGIDSVSNAEATKFSGDNESDAALRMRARRSLESTGSATIGAVLGALTSLPRVREKDVRLSEDPIEHPGIVNLDLALPELSLETANEYKHRAIELLEEYRPVGIRVRHNIEAPLPPGPAPTTSGQDASNEVIPVLASGEGEALHMPVDVNVILQPGTLALTPEEREQLVRTGQQVVEDFIAEHGLGETLIYNRLIKQLMSIDGIQDVTLEMFPSVYRDEDVPRTRNVMPNQVGARPVSGLIDVQVGNALVALDISVKVTFIGAGAIGNIESNASNAAADIHSDLQQALNVFAGSELDPTTLKSLSPGSDSYEVDELHYRVEYIDAGVRINQVDLVIPYTGLEHYWIRMVEVVDEQGKVLGSST